MSAILSCQSVSKKYTKRFGGVKELLIKRPSRKFNRYFREWALQDVSFEVPSGVAFGVVGHNGSGKSTLLSLLLGTVYPDKGDINVRGRVASLLELGAGFHPELTGRDNVKLFCTLMGMTFRESKQKFDSIADFSEIGLSLDDPLRTYSSGMIARLGFSVVAHMSADIILIDEVLGVGDSKFKEKCHHFLRNFVRMGGTQVIVSHEMSSIRSMCEEGLWLHEGRVQARGDIDNVLSKYAESGS